MRTTRVTDQERIYDYVAENPRGIKYRDIR